MSVFRSIFGGGPTPQPERKSNPLMQTLSSYPPNTPPYQGLREDLTPKQLDTNLAYLVETTPQRLGYVTALLASFEIDVTPLLDASKDPTAAAQTIDAWLTKQANNFDILPKSAMGICPVEEFQTSDRSADAIIFSLVADLALLEGEAIRCRDNRYNWAINREAKLRSNETAKRPCLMRPIQPDWAMPVALDMEMSVLFIMHERRGDMGVLHKFGEQLTAIINGAYSG
jgi:hypothetical protein